MVRYPSSHPSEQTLKDFGNGKLDDASVETINRHIKGCPDCQQRVNDMASDSFLDRLRAVHARPGAPSAAAAVAQVAATPALDLIGHPDYRLIRELGSGGMGIVYLAHNQLMGRDEVLKVVTRDMLGRAGVPDRFLREIRAAAHLHHPNIVTAYSAFRIGESLVFAMEYVDGLDLARLVKSKGPLPVPHACFFIHQAALGLQHAHEQGTVHRDIKPGNLMLARPGGRAVVKVLDFGLAKATRESPVRGNLTHEGQMLGTPDFIAPEQIRDAQSADVRADIYSLGCTLYYLLTGKPPFQAPCLYELLQAHFSADAGALNLIRPEVPLELAALVARMMAKDPDRRFQSPSEVARALTPFFRNVPAVRPVSSPGAVEPKLETSQERWASLADVRLTEQPEKPPALEEPSAEPAARLRRRHVPRVSVALAAAAALVLLGVIIVIIIKHDKKPNATTVASQSAPAPPTAIASIPAHNENGPSVPPPWLEESAGKRPPPAADAGAAAVRAVLDEIKQRRGAGKDDRTTLAQQLLDGARQAAVEPDERYARLMVAARFAAEDGEFGLAMDACGELGRWFDVDVIRTKAELLQTHARFAASAPKQDALACAALATGFEALALDHFQFAGTLVRLARRAAEKSGIAALSDEAQLLAEDLSRAQSGYAAVRPQVETLRTHATDPTANTAVGQYLCLAKNDFARGLPMLAQGNERGLRAVAEAELNVLANTANARAADRIALGDSWWSLGDKAGLPRDRCQLRARQWYLGALARDDDPPDATTVARVRSRIGKVPAREFRVRVRARHVDFHELRLDAFGVTSTRNFGAMPTMSFNHITWDTRTVPKLASTGTTRLLPDDLDYTTAEIREAHITGGQWANYGRARAFAREDHSEVLFSHWPDGNFDIEFTLVFGRSVAGKDLAIEPEWTAKFFTWDTSDAEHAPGFRERLFARAPITVVKRRRFNHDDQKQHFASGVPGEFFAMEATCEVELPAGELKIELAGDDGVEFSVDGRTVIDKWGPGGHWETVVVPVTAGRHRLRLRYYQSINDTLLVLRLMML